MPGAPFLRSGLFKLLVFLLGTVVIAALLAPWLYLGGKHAVAQGWLEGTVLDGLHGSLERARFSRYFNRAVLVAGALLLWPTLRWLRAGRLPSEGPLPQRLRSALLLRANPAWRSHLALGFAAAAGTLLSLGWIYVAAGWYEPRETEKALLSILFASLGTALAVALLEEAVFRGALPALLCGILGPRAVFWSVAFFFALVHFFHGPPNLEFESVGALTGFVMVGAIFAHFFGQFADPFFLLAEFAVLLAVGIVLGWARVATGSLWLGIGLHAGWVFGVKTLSALAERGFERAEMMPWLGDNLRVGLVSTLVVLATGAALAGWWRCCGARAGEGEAVESGDEPAVERAEG